MRKFVFSSLLVSVVIMLITFNLAEDSAVHLPSGTETSTPKRFASAQHVIQTAPKTYPTKEVERLAKVQTRCRHTNNNLSANIAAIHQPIIAGLEQALRRGASIRELLSYRDQYTTYYRSFFDLLAQARINIGKEKYQTADSVAILNHWQGLSVIGLKQGKITQLLQYLRSVGNSDDAVTLSLSIDKKASKQDVLSLLNNVDSFNTYLESPLAIGGGRAISPSILFVMSAQVLSLKEFSDAVAGASFTVNDVAVAIKNKIPNAYIKVLIEHTNDLSATPIFYQNNWQDYYTIADLAVAEYNVEILKLLAIYGVTPINEPGILTGLDIAITNLPTKPIAHKEQRDKLSHYENTITYLHNNGYRAHGEKFEASGKTELTFQAPNTVFFDSGNIAEPALRDALMSIELIPFQSTVLQVKPDNSDISTAISISIKARAHIEENQKNCVEVAKRIVTVQGFKTVKQALALVRDIAAKENNVAVRLHEIDPALVHLWQYSEQFERGYELYMPPGEFSTLIENKLYERAVEYVTEFPLSRQETDYLFGVLVRKPSEIMAVWDMRVSAKVPSNFDDLRYLPIKQWHNLVKAGFDMSITDMWGNDLYIMAFLHSQDAVNILVEENIPFNLDSLGLDAFDLALEDSYEKATLNKNIFKFMPPNNKIEPNHYRRIARLKTFYPAIYQQLVKENSQLIPPQNVDINIYRLSGML